MKKKFQIWIFLIIAMIVYSTSLKAQNTNLTKEELLELVKITSQNNELKNLANNLYQEIDNCENLNASTNLTNAQLIEIIKRKQTRIDFLEQTNSSLLIQLSENDIKHQDELNNLDLDLQNFKRKADKRVSVGISAGYGIMVPDILNFAPSVNLGIQYRLFRL